MLPQLRVLMADDSAVVRRLVGDVLQETPGIELTGTARNGRDALAMISTHRPDVILLDVEMPVMNGIEALREIRRTDHRTPVLMFSSLTVRGGEATLDALTMGASDYFPKPTSRVSRQESIDYIRSGLIPRIRQWADGSPGHRRRIGSRETLHVHRKPESGRPRPRQPVDVIAIGASTGGPNALAQIIPLLPANLHVPVLVTQHMPALFTRLLADRLNQTSPLTVTEARHGEKITPGKVLIAPGDFHMTIEYRGAHRRIALNQDPKEHACRPAVDVTFRSVAGNYGSRCLGIVLTGMGRDGMEGCRAIRHFNGSVVAQDAESCVVWGMPRAVEQAGLAERIVPLNQMHSEIILHARSGRSQPALSRS